MNRFSQRGVSRRFVTGLAVAALSLSYLSPAAAQAPKERIEIRAVVVTAFEEGEDTGDAPGEFQAWAREAPTVLDFPLGYRHLRYDPKRGLLVISTGMGTNRAAVSTMALGIDPRFDLTHAYWLVAAIAGVNPNAASAGSAAWIGDVVDSDYSKMIDVREVPRDWSTGLLPYERAAPYQQPRPEDTSYALFPLNKGLRDWAYDLTRNMKLPDSEALQNLRAHYVGYPNAQKPPFVLKGDEISGQAYWHGKLLNEHFEKWASYWTGGSGQFVMTAMEDTGVLNAIRQLERAGLADSKRVMILRTGSNYSMPPPGVDAVTSLTRPYGGSGEAALTAAHMVGGKVVNEITGGWAKYRDSIPQTSR